jgi:hypothetical protein
MVGSAKLLPRKNLSSVPRHKTFEVVVTEKGNLLFPHCLGNGGIRACGSSAPEHAQEFARNNFCKEFPALLICRERRRTGILGRAKRRSVRLGNQPIEKVLIFLLHIKSCDQTRKQCDQIW